MILCKAVLRSKAVYNISNYFFKNNSGASEGRISFSPINNLSPGAMEIFSKAFFNVPRLVTALIGLLSVLPYSVQIVQTSFWVS